MSKELEAFKRIRCNYVSVFKARENGKTQLVYDLNTVEKALKDKKSKDKVLGIIRKTISTDLHFDCEEDTERWYVWIDCEGYQVYIFEGQGKEQYDLLKEVLL